MSLFNKHNFQIADFCAKESSRAELNGIFIEPQRTTATDSFTLISVSTPTGFKIDNYPSMPNKPTPKENFKPFILPAEDGKALTKLLSRKVSVPILENAVILRSDNETAEIGATDLQSFQSITPKIIQGEFPKFNDILVERGSFIEISVNPAYLVKIGQFFSKFLIDKTLKIKIPKEVDRPIFFYGKTEKQSVVAVLMPVKSSE